MDENTEAKNQLGAFRKEMAKITFDSEEVNDLYVFMLKNLGDLVKETDRFYTETNGAYPNMDEDAFDQFTRLYRNAFDSMKECREAISAQAGEKETWAIQLIGAVQNFLGEDLVLLSSAKEKGLSTLPEIIENARAKVVDVTGQELSTVGANMSSRRKITVPGKDGNDSVSGFFTESISLDTESEKKALYDRTVQNNPKMKALIDEIEEIDQKQGPVWRDLEYISEFVDKWANLGGNISKNNYVRPEHLFDKYMPEQLSQDQLDAFFGRDNLFYPFLEYVKDRDKIGKKYQLLDDSEIKNNKDLGERNSAMSFVADLLGMDGLIARAEPMILQDEEKKIHGTFMHKVIGTDISESKIGDPLLRPDAEIDYDSNDLKKQIADLQVLDYICGNTDRHAANMFYQIDDSDKKHPRVTGIQGIDNDNSFGTIHGAVKELPAIRDMMVIREGTSSVIMGLNEDMLKTTLRNFKLSSEEVQAAWDRTKQLQDAIQDGMEFYRNQAPDVLKAGHLRIVKENEWQKFKAEDLATNSYFAVVSKVHKIAATKYFERELDHVDEDYRKVSISLHDDQPAQIKEMIQELEKADKHVWGGSNEYKRVKEAVKNLESVQDELYQPDFKAGARALKEAYKQTMEVADQYLKRKMDELNEQLKGKSESDKKKITDKFMDPETKNGKRMAAVSALATQVKEYVKQLNRMEELKEKHEKLKRVLGSRDKMEEIKKLMPKQKGERVRMTMEELESFGRPRSKSMVVKKEPQKEKNLERRSMNPKSIG